MLNIQCKNRIDPLLSSSCTYIFTRPTHQRLTHFSLTFSTSLSDQLTHVLYNNTLDTRRSSIDITPTLTLTLT
jgi:hypothetical protein